MQNNEQKSSMPGSKGRAFTLIELLVVIAIIAILAAILFPVFARARENARRSSCQSNLKQIALGMMQYTQDYDERFPRFNLNTYANTTQTNLAGWADAMLPYTKNEQILQCPSEPTSQTTNSNWQFRVWSTSYNDYWMNYNVSQQALAALDAPSVSVLFGDGDPLVVTDVDTLVGDTTRGRAIFVYRGVDKGVGNFVRFAGASRHLDGANIAFADGHVKWQKGYGGNHPEYSQSIYARDTGTDAGVPTFSIKAGGG